MNDEDIDLTELRLSETEGFAEALAKAYLQGKFDMFKDVTLAHKAAHETGDGESDFCFSMVYLGLHLNKDMNEAGL